MNGVALAALTALTAVAPLVTGGCNATTDKSGGTARPITLVLASNDGLDPIGDPALAHFVELVSKKSRGRVQVKVPSRWHNTGEQQVLADVTAGKAALGWSGTRAFDLIGANAFQTLHAPFLIQSYAAERAVVRDSVAQDMLARLAGTGLTGLALLADQLRFPAAAEGPLLNAGDFDGLVFGVMPSKIQAAAIRELGAQVHEITDPSASGTEGLGSLGLHGLETMWTTYARNGQQSIAPFVTANAVLWPRTTVIVANTHAFERLDSDDRAVLTRAATETTKWSLKHAEDNAAEYMTLACQYGARIATASPGQLAGLTRASLPTYASLRADPEQATLLARVERLVRAAGPAEPVQVPDGCAYRPGDDARLGVEVMPPPLTHPGESGGLPAGTYRYTLTVDEIDKRFHMGREWAIGNAGVWTWTLGEGRWLYDVKVAARVGPAAEGTSCEGYYDVHGNEVDFTTLTRYQHGDCAPPTWKAQWRRTEHGLHLDAYIDPSGHPDFIFGGKTWERINN